MAPQGPPYRRSADGYDGLYTPKKDYRREAIRLMRIVRRDSGPTGGTWLDVACGTGLHLPHIGRRFRVEGVDASPEMLAFAQARLPSASFQLGDMRTFELKRPFDVVSCLFSSIGYMTSIADLHRAISNLARHVREGGVVVVEPWFSPTTYRPGTVHMDAIEGRGRTSTHQVRMIVAKRRGRISVMDAHHLVGTPSGVEHFVERHRMGLFTRSEYVDALKAAGLEPRYEPEGISDRGLHVGYRRRSAARGTQP